MIRVDQAGEYGAMRIYQGQLAVLGDRTKDRKAAAAIRRMAEQEARHLARFDRLLNERKVRPTALSPLWQVAGYALGAGTALLGSRAAMACTAAVEEVIDEHYGKQIERLDRDPLLRHSVREFRADERAHRKEALAHGAAGAAGYRALSGAIKTACRLAIRLSEKI
ncbi:MAG: demethoxyubiquinone hydroxylase family protein [Rhizomicrobium sp.]